MRKLLTCSLVFLAAAACAGQEAREIQAIAAAIAKLSPHVAPEIDRDALSGQLSRAGRQRVAAANRASSDAWDKINSREDWEAFHREKLAALRQSLGTLPPRPVKPRSLVTGEVDGDGFKILNVVYESRPGLVVTANFYVPDPMRESMPGIVISHSHHNPKEQGELQDMGMTWARAGCYVLVPDHLGHGERRQHRFVTAADYAGSFQVGRQDYYFRYDTSLQLYLSGETLMGWLVHDVMTGISFLLDQPGIDAKRIILLGAVAGGGDPAGVTAALDERVACVCPFNFGGPQPETRFPLPDDAETSFNYAGGGSWESTRNLYRSAADGFLPWVIVGSIATRHLIHAHEFAWDRERDPVWRRYQKIWSLYGAEDRLAFAHGQGTLTGTDPPGSHCNNIGAVHRRQIHEAFARWFGIEVRPEEEYSSRRNREVLACLTESARNEFKPKLLHEILSAQADEQLAAARQKFAALGAVERRQAIRSTWSQLLGDVEPAASARVRDGSPASEQVAGINVRRELLETEPGITIAVLTLSLDAFDKRGATGRLPIVGIASDGIGGALARRCTEIADGLKSGAVVALVEVRGMGEMGPGNDHGQQSSLTSAAATQLMLGRTLLGGQLRDLRVAWRHLRSRTDIARDELVVIGGSGIDPRAEDAPFSFPRRVERRPLEIQPNAALLALLIALYEDEVSVVGARHGLVSFRSLLDSQFVQAPLSSLVPGVFAAGDIPDLVAALHPRPVALEALVDGTGRLVPEAAARRFYVPILRKYGDTTDRVEISGGEREGGER